MFVSRTGGGVVPATSANNEATEASAESIEKRPPKRLKTEPRGTPNRLTCSEHRVGRTGCHAVCTACPACRLEEDSTARKDSQLIRFTALLHHVNEDCLRNAFFYLKKTAAVGVDGEHGYVKDVVVNCVLYREAVREISRW